MSTAGDFVLVVPLHYPFQEIPSHPDWTNIHISSQVNLPLLNLFKNFSHLFLLTLVFRLLPFLLAYFRAFRPYLANKKKPLVITE